MGLNGFLILLAYLAIGLFIYSAMDEIGNDDGPLHIIFIVTWPIVLIALVFVIIFALIHRFGSWAGKHINKFMEDFL